MAVCNQSVRSADSLSFSIYTECAALQKVYYETNERAECLEDGGHEESLSSTLGFTHRNKGICIDEPNPPRQAGKQIVAEACEGSYEDS